jgi:hypothetical protein
MARTNQRPSLSQHGACGISDRQRIDLSRLPQGASQVGIDAFSIARSAHVRSEAASVPVNVEAILRDIRKQFSSRKRVFDAVNAIINESLLRKILDVRNDAAHASTNGVRRELNRDEIDAAVLRTALFLFGNVAFAVAEKEEPT